MRTAIVTMHNSNLRKPGKDKANCKTKVSRPYPCAAWEKGSYENAKRIVRRCSPKGTDISKVPSVADGGAALRREAAARGRGVPGTMPCVACIPQLKNRSEAG